MISNDMDNHAAAATDDDNDDGYVKADVDED